MEEQRRAGRFSPVRRTKDRISNVATTESTLLNTPEALAAYRAALKGMPGYAPAKQNRDAILANKTLR
jgi:hypothetical protein